MNIRFAVVVAISVCIAASVFAQTPTVVTTFPSTSNAGSTFTHQFTPVGDAIYFYADPENDYPAIWKWTEAAGAQRVKTVQADYYSSVSLLAFNDKLLVSAYVDSRGHELWITDGTTTTLVKDIYPGGSSAPVLMGVAGTKAYFTASEPEHGRELWVTDGTLAGTTIVTDLTGDSDSSYPTVFIEANGKAYFHALDQLWVSDGTEAGTVALASGVSGTPAAVLGSEVVFLGSDAGNGRELWSTDGTPGGTAIIKDINPGPASSWGGIPSRFVKVGSALLFFAEDAVNGRELWKTDGTEAGTELVADITPGMASSSLDRLFSSSSGAFFLRDDTEVWFSDGTGPGTIAIGSYARVLALSAATNGAYFVTNEPALMFSDGTVAGTIEITNVTPGTAPQFTPNGAAMLFNGTDGTLGFEPWISDGTVAGTEMLDDVSGSVYQYSSPTPLIAAGSNVYYRLGGKLWGSDGTAAGTIALGDAPDSYPYSTLAAAPLGGTLLYRGGAVGAIGLWKTNGTVAGTSLVKSFRGIESIVPGTSGYALLVASEAADEPYTLWRTDGTEAGTTKLVPSFSTYSPPNAVDLAGQLFFLARHEYYDRWLELWTTGGTAGTTHVVMKGNFAALEAAGGALYLSHHETASGRELWRSDGTGDGFAMVKDIAPGPESSEPSNFASAGHLLFFVADDEVHGRELWRTDGTEAGTFMLKDIAAGTASSSPSRLVSSGRYLYFFAGDNTYGTELWRTDGTSAGTMRLTDSSYYTSYFAPLLTAFDTKILFQGFDNFHGAELWESDGSVAGTFFAFDLISGTESSSPRYLTVARDLMFFTTNDGKLWTLARAATRVSIQDSRIVEGDAGSAVLQFTVTRSGNTTGATTVNYLTENITATAGSDYQAASGSVSFAAGETTRTISVTILGDTVLEKNESFALTLTSATGAVLVRDRACGIIEENDRRVALSVEYVPKYSSYYGASRTFKITNTGPSGATVTLKVSESPFEGTFHCDGKNPSTCQVGFVPAGGSVEFAVQRSSSSALTESGIIPGHTLTATVSALEAENDLSDNTTARMTNPSGFLSLPPYLVAGGTGSAQATTHNGYFPATLRPSLSGGVIVSPASATVTSANPRASFSLTVAPNAWGWSTVKNGSTTLMRIPFVFEGETAKLDTTIKAITNDYYVFEFDHAEPVVLPVRVAATLHDGTRPSGTVTLKKVDGTVVQVKTVDAGGNATFTLGSMAVGTYDYRVTYSGDANFNPVTVDLPDVRVEGWPTYTDVLIVTQPCGSSQIIVTVSNPDHTPTGTVKLTHNSSDLATVPLVATGTPGEAQATYNHSFSSPWGSVYATYQPDSPFEASSDWGYFESGTCPAPTMLASASTATSVALLWSDVGAPLYEIVRAQAPSPTLYTSVGTTANTSFVDTTAVAGKAYLYRVLAKNAAGATQSTSASDLATTVIFTDDPIVFKQTRFKAVHITELQQAANAVRALANLSAATFAPVASGGAMKASDITSLRTALEQAYAALALPGFVWTDGVATGLPIKAVHVQQLRNGVK